MNKRRILVVDDSPAMRETLCVLLGGSYEVRAVDRSDLRLHKSAPWDLTIAAVDLQSSSDLPAASRLWLGADPAQEGLSRCFTPSDLRRIVADALQIAPRRDLPDHPRDWRLERPFLDEASRAVVERARATGLALHITGEPGSGKHAVARSIHGNKGGRFLICDAANPSPTREEIAQPATVLAIGVDRWPAASQRALAATLDAAAAPHLRIISTASCDVGELVDRGEMLPDLYYQLTLLAIHLRPLRERPQELPMIASALAAEIADRLGQTHPAFSDSALQRLSRYLWFGNMAEMQAVLTRTLALCQSPRIKAEDLRFDGAAPAHTAAATVTGAELVDPGPATAGNLSLIIHELAHEFKNPLVTIKTFTQHCQKSLLAAEPDEMQFAQLTDRAVDQMDRSLENLVAFTRMTTPSPQNVSLASVLDPVFANGSDLHVDYTAPAPVMIRVDPLQTSYAVQNLLRALSRDAPADKPLTAQFCPPDALLCQLPAGAATSREKLIALVDDDGITQTEAMPLGIAIASAILERNGAELHMSRDGEPKTVMIRFPLVVNEEEAEVNRDGTSPSIDR